MGCATADLDNDGFQDLIVTGIKGNYPFKNNGDRTFTNVTSESGIIPDGWSTGASITDFNRDGLPDIYISNYIQYNKGAKTFERISGFRITTDVAFDQALYDPEPNRLYLIVLNDNNSPNQLYINEQGKQFSRSNTRYAPLEITGAHDLIHNDFSGDSTAEFFMTRGMRHPPVFLIYSSTQQGYLDNAWSSALAQTRLLPFSGWAALAADFNNDGAAGFHYQPALGNGQYPNSSRGAITADLNNDGRLEIITSTYNGYDSYSGKQ